MKCNLKCNQGEPPPARVVVTVGVGDSRAVQHMRPTMTGQPDKLIDSHAC